MMQYVGQPMQMVMMVKYYRGTPRSLEMNPAISKKHQEPERQPWAILSTLSLSLCSSSSCFSSQCLLWSLLSVHCLVLFCPGLSVPGHLASTASSWQIPQDSIPPSLSVPLGSNFTANYLTVSLVSLHWHHSWVLATCKGWPPWVRDFLSAWWRYR